MKQIECLKKTTTYKVHKDGTWTMESSIKLKVLNEAGRQTLSTQTFTYDATNTIFEVLKAKTTRRRKKAIVLENSIEDKPLASDPLGLSENHQIFIPFERVTLGSIIHLKLRTHFFKPTFEGYFAESLNFRDDYLWRQARITIISEMPLFMKINDPRKSLRLKVSQDQSKHILQLRLKKPIFEQLTDESDSSHGEPALYTSVHFSTEKDYERIGKLEAQFYQPRLKEKPPKKLERIRRIVRKINDEADCIDMIVTRLISKISYLGSWNIAEGHFAPRSLKAIITSGYGDCKEFSVCLAAILNTLGYQAKVAVVNRDEIYLEEDTLPINSEFNHAIVKAIGPSGKIYWIDPTNDVSMANGIFPDIADRPVLVLDPDNPTYERIPPIDYQHAITRDVRTISLTDGGYVHTEGSICHEGEQAIELTRLCSIHPCSKVVAAIIRGITENDDPINPIVKFSEYPSRIVKPLETTFSYRQKDTMIHTNYGDAFPLKGHWHEPYVETSQTDEGALYAGDPKTLISKMIFKNVSAVNLEKLAFSIQTPWLNARRDIFVTDEGVVVTETFERLKSIIPAKELKSEEFSELKRTLRRYCDGVAIIFSINKDSSSASSSTDRFAPTVSSRSFTTATSAVRSS